MVTTDNVSITNPRKRQRDEVDEREIDARSFTIKPDPSEPFAAPRVFAPICLLQRAQLPLAYLDTISSGSRLFAAHVNVLESAHDHDDDASVLVAQEKKEKKLYAIERVKKRLYALCRLGEWVKEEDAVTRSRCILRQEVQVKRRALQPVQDRQPWWMSASVQMPEAQGKADVPKPKLDMKADADTAMEKSVPVCEDQFLPSDTEDPAARQDPLNTSALTPLEVMQDLTKQYLDALYLSRTSLAYFTKGPLSRARAAFASMSTTAASAELVDFLREAILTSTIMDKKYKDGISSVVKELPTRALESPEQPKKAKRKRKWKAKRDKHGFLFDEKDVVERWWLDHDDLQDGSSSAESIEQALRRRLSKVRSRETFLQLILVLEVLALEAVLPEAGRDGNTQAVAADEPQAADTQRGSAGERKSKPKKRQDLVGLLETLLDRLCIWHSLESHSPLRRSGDESREDGHDDLQSFCIEVIIPFYIPRIPDHANSVNKKLGGPTAPTQAKRKTASSRKPGEPAARQAPEKKARKPLSRVATDTLDQSTRRMPSLNRSATDSDALSAYIKRETSEVPLESIPAANQPRRPRQSLMQKLNSSTRQVDFTAMSQANQTKLQKKAEADAIIKSAIDTLRKPNRSAAVAELRDSTDQSFAKATAISKSSTVAQKQRATQKPEITATPSHRRTVKATPHRRAVDQHDGQRTHSSGTTHVTSSTARITHNHQNVPSSSFAVPQTGHKPRHAPLQGGTGVEETPSRGFAKFMPVGLARQPGILESPTMSGKVDATPSKPVRSLSLGVTTTPLVAASPNVQRREDPDGESNEIAGEGGPGASIYDALGWEEDAYEELT